MPKGFETRWRKFDANKLKSFLYVLLQAAAPP
jgi:hypothetical protein